MNKRSLLFMAVILLSVISAASQPTQKANLSSVIDSIFITPSKYVNETVTVEGVIVQYVAEPTKTTAFYILKSDYGATIKVITSSSEPAILKRYTVNGIVSYEAAGPIIKENSKVCLDCPVIVAEPPLGWFERNLLYVIIGLVVLAIAILIIVLILTRRKPAQDIYQEMPTEPKEPSGDYSPPTSPVKPTVEIKYDDSYQTIKVPKIADVPSTLKFIPVGKLTIQSGPDAGRTLALSGFSTSEGVSLSFGRESEGWKEYLINKKHFNPNRLLAHILIKDPTSTLSRLQAEMIFTNNRMHIRHHGSNPTIVNGAELPVGVLTELPFGATIQAGAMEFKFIE